jgi:hypothetical protein
MVSPLSGSRGNVWEREVGYINKFLNNSSGCQETDVAASSSASQRPEKRVQFLQENLQGNFDKFQKLFSQECNYFYGWENDPIHFLEVAERLKSEIGESAFLRLLPSLFKGYAYRWFDSVKGNVKNFKTFESTFVAEFLGKNYDETIYNEMANLKQRSEETIEQFIGRQGAVHERAFYPLSESCIVNIVKGNVNSSYWRLKQVRVKTLKDLLSAAGEIDAEDSQKKF